MKLPQQAIDDFLTRPRKRFDQYKALRAAELDRLVRKLPAPIPLWDKLRKHQRVMALIGARTRKFAFFADTGCGKTVTSLALAQYFTEQGVVERVLILAPTRAVKYEWVREIEKHTPHLSYCVLNGSSSAKWDQLMSTDALLVIATYPGVMRMVTSLVKVRKRNRLKPDRKRVLALASYFQGLVLDESTAVKNHTKLPYRICRQIAKRCEMVFALTGTPFGRDPSDLWAQMNLIDNGKTLGETLGLFRAIFFYEHANLWRIEYKFRKRMMPLLTKFLANRSIRYEANEADLPRVTRIIKSVALPEDARNYYRRALQEIRRAKGNPRACKNAFLRMRQISSGFVGFVDDDTDEKAQYEFPVNPKLELLLALIESLNDKAVVFHEYTYSGTRISAELKKLGIGHLRLFGGTKKPEDVLRQFDRSDARVLLLQNQFGMGLNLQAARYGIFYESPVSPIIRKQCRRRVERQGSAHRRVFIYDLVAKGTVDAAILAWLKAGDDLLRGIIDGRAKL